jgi:hypothetical protein
MTPPINIDGTTVDAITIDGTDVREVTVDGSTVFGGIPDSGLLHNYDWNSTATTTSTVPDLAGSDHLTGGFSNLNGSINGIQAGTFDGTDDSLDGTFATSLSQPYTVYFVSRSNDNNGIQALTDGTSNQSILGRRFNDDDYQLLAGNTSVNGGSLTTGNEILTARFDGSNSVIRRNGTQVLSGDPGDNGLAGLIVSRSDLPVDGVIGQLLVYDPTVSGYSRSDVEQALADKWGIALA